jgi:hypothetical protein
MLKLVCVSAVIDIGVRTDHKNIAVLPNVATISVPSLPSKNNLTETHNLSAQKSTTLISTATATTTATTTTPSTQTIKKLKTEKKNVTEAPEFQNDNTEDENDVENDTETDIVTQFDEFPLNKGDLLMLMEEEGDQKQSKKNEQVLAAIRPIMGGYKQFKRMNVASEKNHIRATHKIIKHSRQVEQETRDRLRGLQKSSSALKS